MDNKKVDDMSKQLGFDTSTTSGFHTQKVGDKVISVSLTAKDPETGEVITHFTLDDASQAILLVGTPATKDGHDCIAMGGVMLCGDLFLRNALDQLEKAHKHTVKQAFENLDLGDFKDFMDGLLAEIARDKGLRQ